MSPTNSIIVYEPSTTIILSCLVHSNPNATFFWYFNETLLNKFNQIENYTQIHNQNSTTLIIYNNQIKNSGFFKCTAKNSVGFASNIFFLRQASEPATPVNLTIINKTYSNLTINWDLPFDGGTNKTSYIVQIYDELNLCAEIESNKKILTIKSNKKIYLFIIIMYAQ